MQCSLRKLQYLIHPKTTPYRSLRYWSYIHFNVQSRNNQEPLYSETGKLGGNQTSKLSFRPASLWRDLERQVVFVSEQSANSILEQTSWNCWHCQVIAAKPMWPSSSTEGPGVVAELRVLAAKKEGHKHENASSREGRNTTATSSETLVNQHPHAKRKMGCRVVWNVTRLLWLYSGWSNWRFKYVYMLQKLIFNIVTLPPLDTYIWRLSIFYAWSLNIWRKSK